jgi:hypothetical protein
VKSEIGDFYENISKIKFILKSDKKSGRYVKTFCQQYETRSSSPRMQTEATVGLPWQNAIALYCLERHVTR